MRDQTDMSTNREIFEITYEIFAGTSKSFETTILDPDTNTPKDLSDSLLYGGTSVARIYDPMDKQIGTDMPILFLSRENGIVQFSIPHTIATTKNAGNWKGKIIFSNGENTIDQQTFGLNILL